MGEVEYNGIMNFYAIIKRSVYDMSGTALGARMSVRYIRRGYGVTAHCVDSPGTDNLYYNETTRKFLCLLH